MKLYVQSILFFLTVVLRTSIADTDIYLDFKSREGKTVRAKIVNYEKSSDTVTMERDNHKRYTIEVDVFSETDRNFIRNWNEFRALFEDSGLNISVNRISPDEDGQQTTSTNPNRANETRWMSVAQYEVRLKNCTAQTLDNIRVEVIPFFKYEVVDPARNVEFKIKSKHSMIPFDISSIDPNDHKEVMTRTWGYESVEGKNDSGDLMKNIIEFQGVWVRVYTMLPNGTELVLRDIQEPSDIWQKINWENATQAIDLNTHEVVDEDSVLPEGYKSD